MLERNMLEAHTEDSKALISLRIYMKRVYERTVARVLLGGLGGLVARAVGGDPDAKSWQLTSNIDHPVTPRKAS